MVIKQFCCIFHIDSVWKNDFDFIHVLLRAVQRQDVQSSMERYKARWVNTYFSICLLTDLWDCWLLLTTCLSIILGYHKSLSHNRVLGLTQKFGFVNWLFKNSIYHCTKIGIKWRMIFPVVNAIYVIAYEAWKKFRASMGFEPVASRY